MNIIEVFATYSELKKAGIKHQTPRKYLDEIVYTYTIYCNDGSKWGYSSEDDIFYKE